MPSDQQLREVRPLVLKTRVRGPVIPVSNMALKTPLSHASLSSLNTLLRLENYCSFVTVSTWRKDWQQLRTVL